MDFRGNRIWEYYTRLAERMGTNSVGRETSFSVAWIYRFYNDNNNRFNQLAKVFLGLERRDVLCPDRTFHININDYLVEPGPNMDQAAAIELSLHEPVTFIQGPPGTGKSRTILNLMSCIVNGLGKTVLMASANNAAVEVISEKIEEYEGAIGLGNAAAYILENRENLNNTFARLGNKKVVEAFNESHDDYNFHYSKDESLGVSVVDNVSFEEFSRDYKAIISTLHSMKKLFSEGPNVQFDYVIIDESSQVNPLLGLIALSSAKHLIIVGDEEQLPPIIKTENFVHITDEYGLVVPDDYMICDDENGKAPSFLDIGLRRFLRQDCSNKIFLRDHYRCHPSIIEFCNRNVYDNRLRVMTGEVDTSGYKVPIKVLWYQGDYCEKTYLGEAGSSDTSKRNGKQAEIFVREELPVLIARMQSPETNTMDSFSILSPFRGVLMELGKKITEYINSRNLQNELMVSINGHSIEEDGADNEIPVLSVYKSQGREYDVVYLLPAEDANWDKPWSQGRNLINVAVSRAKEELRIICSTSLMSEPMQKALLNCNEVIPDSERRTENFRYVQKLIDYVKIANDSREEYESSRNVWDPNGIYSDLDLTGTGFDFPISWLAEPTGFGFHRSNVISVFDAAPCIRRDAEEIRNDNESFLQCVIQAIAKLEQFREEKLNMYTDVMLTDITDSVGEQVISPQLVRAVLTETGYEQENIVFWNDEQLDLHVDLVITDRDDKILLMIEVDGGYHRFNTDAEQLQGQIIRDKAKKTICDRYLNEIPFLSLPADGTGTDEITKIENALLHAPLQNYICKTRCITSIDRERAHELKERFVNEGYLTERHIWYMESDGLSWKMNPSERLYVVPTLQGEAAGIVRHYSTDRNGVLYMNPEYLDRFVDRYISEQ